MKNKVKPDKIVKCEGTKDGIGLRLVLETNKLGIVARKIKKFYGFQRGGCYNFYFR